MGIHQPFASLFSSSISDSRERERARPSLPPIYIPLLRGLASTWQGKKQGREGQNPPPSANLCHGTAPGCQASNPPEELEDAHGTECGVQGVNIGQTPDDAYGRSTAPKTSTLATLQSIQKGALTHRCKNPQRPIMLMGEYRT
ncbi:uncharacterized protein UV8b_06204 [Ustilaginoidea virens]|uniref:Uncharacterized protein n=1 Tax=Ustilaginoidea virens TaxID=1159556 RepID=A0A8E5MIV6_USTVR|nr:uncharacterized protein UV8b_06204 [Ustilaginoidea virens]QUC21963.1 hypothetical protein UV8b_06204 [Ustilaginoidea virens]